MPALIEPPTPADLRAFMASHNLTREQFAALVPVTVDALYKWLSGARAVPVWMNRIMHDISRELKESAP